MKLVVVSPEGNRADEHVVLDAMFNAGLERYHVRKPRCSVGELARWIEGVPPRWRRRLVLHQHHDLVDAYQLGGRHWRDDGSATAPGSGWASRSCHDLGTLRGALGVYDSVLFGPVFPSISKPDYAPKDAQVGEALGALLYTRTERERGTAVIALGGITHETAPRARVLGFDGVAVLGAVWQAPDPVAAFQRLAAGCRREFACDPSRSETVAPTADGSFSTASRFVL